MANLIPRRNQPPVSQLAGDCGGLPAQRAAAEDNPGDCRSRHDCGHRPIGDQPLERGTQCGRRQDQRAGMHHAGSLSIRITPSLEP
jgi:hypothetical protein